MLWEIELGVLEKYILMASKIVHLLLSPSGMIDVALSFKDKLVAFTQRCLMPSLVENSPLALENMMFLKDANVF